MPAAYIFCPSYVFNINKINIPMNSNSNGNIFIAADSGIETALKLNIKLDLLIGDFDSINFKKYNIENIKIIKYPTIKNDTDSMLAVKYALETGYKNINIIGGLDGRIDHTLANLCLLQYIDNRGGFGCITNGYNRITYLANSNVKIYKNFKYVSVLPVNSEIYGLTLKGFKYNLDNASVRFDEPYTVCNEISDDSEYGEISITNGEALICECDDMI